MEERRIIWDEAKNAVNKMKHKIGFEVAQYVFADPLRIWRLDRSENNTSGETRWQTIGKESRKNLLCGLHRAGRRGRKYYVHHIGTRSREA
jgi:uncharacterized DUF497 family protein